MRFSTILGLSAAMFLGFCNPVQAGEELHASYDALLHAYVSDGLVDYDQLAGAPADVEALGQYIRSLEGVNPDSLETSDALAYWINLYNAVTLRLILDHYPVESIKDIGGFFSSPWKKKLVTINGKELTLNKIENDIIRPQFKDARIHFALNCASIGCPPLANHAFLGSQLDEQLDQASTFALSKEIWLKTGKNIFVSKLFDWYKNDFVEYAGSVRKYIAEYRPDVAEDVLDEKIDIKFMKYNWKLNKTR